MGFNDEGCTFGGEELDLSVRARAAGFDVGYVGSATVLHSNLIRTGEVGRERRERWVYNFVRVFGKHFPLPLALSLSSRYFASHLVSGVRAFSPIFGLRLARATLSGFKAGRREREYVPDHVVQLYRDPSLRPEYGNVPILQKIIRSFRRR